MLLKNKTGDIQRMFSSLAPEYDRFNRWSSLGLDGWWRRAVLRELPETGDVLDVGTGTGALARAAHRPGRFTAGLDFSLEMLEGARRLGPGPAWVQGRADDLPFHSECFDAVVSAYVLRNLLRGEALEGSLAESFRVLRPGGRLIILDLTRPRFPWLAWGHGLYVKTVVPGVGRWIFGDRWPGDYLRSSIDDLMSFERLEECFRRAGFEKFGVRPLSGGIVSLFSGEKPC